MPSTYSKLKIELIGEGEQDGTWGSTTNTNLGTAIEEAITGSADITFSGSDVAIVLTNTNATQAARNLRLNLIGVSGGARNLTVPNIKKLYLVNNTCADAITVKTPAGTGIAVSAGKSTFVYSDSINVVEAANSFSSLSLDSPLAIDSGGTGASDASTARTNLGVSAAGADTAYAFRTNNLSDLDNIATARINLGVTATGGDASYATAAQGALADTAIQPADNISTLTNDSGFISGNQEITLSGDLSGSGTTSINASIGTGAVGANEIANGSITAQELSISNGNGTSTQYLRSDGDGTFTWATVSSTTFGSNWTNFNNTQRVNNVNYTNTTGNMMPINVKAPNGGDGTSGLSLFVGGVQVFSAGSTRTINGFTMVPPGKTYRYSGTDIQFNAVIVSELR